MNPSMKLPKIPNASGQPSSRFFTRLFPVNNSLPVSQPLANSRASFFHQKIVALKESISLKLLGNPSPFDFDQPHWNELLSDFMPVTPAEVSKLLQSMSNKSSQLDYIPTSLLKSCADIFSILSFIFFTQKKHIINIIMSRLASRGSISSGAAMPSRFTELRFCPVIAIVSHLLCIGFEIVSVFAFSLFLPSGTWPGWPSPVDAVGIRRDSISIESGFLVLGRDKLRRIPCIVRPAHRQHLDLPGGPGFGLKPHPGRTRTHSQSL